VFRIGYLFEETGSGWYKTGNETVMGNSCVPGTNLMAIRTIKIKDTALMPSPPTSDPVDLVGRDHPPQVHEEQGSL